MAFCSNCGSELAPGAKFCPNCGKSLSAHTEAPKRKQEYAGTVRKCPACGETIGALVAICPACGHELNSAELSDSLSEFIENLDAIEKEIAELPAPKKKRFKNLSTGQKVLWIILNMLLLCLPLTASMAIPRIRAFVSRHPPHLSPVEKKKAALIENYTFPGDRASVLEALLFVKSKVAFLSSDAPDQKSLYWLSLWATKAEQLHEKAKLLLGDDKIATDAYGEILQDTGNTAKSARSRAVIATVLIVLHLALLGAASAVLIPKVIAAVPSVSVAKTYEYPKSALSDLLPTLRAESGETIKNTDDELYLSLTGVSEKEFEAFRDACLAGSFPAASERTATTLTAIGNGCTLTLKFYSFTEELQIHVTRNKT